MLGWMANNGECWCLFFILGVLAMFTLEGFQAPLPCSNSGRTCMRDVEVMTDEDARRVDRNIKDNNDLS